MMGIKSFLISILFISLLIFFYPVLGNCKNISPSYQNSIGDNYFFGKNGVNKNYVKAVRLYNKAAAQGYAPSESNLGWAYFSGKGVQQNYSKAVYWYKKAALQGYIQAEINLGAAYNHGKGVKINYSKAVYWFKMASHKEIKIAGTFLGNAYFYGKGVPKNYTKAIYWYKKAAAQGDTMAKENLNYINLKHGTIGSILFKIMKYLMDSSWVILAIDLILLVLSLIDVLRHFTGTAIFLSSYIFGVLTGIICLIYSFTIFGIWGVVVGLFSFFLPVAIIAAIHIKEWSMLIELIVLGVIIFAARIIGIMLISMKNKKDTKSEVQNYFNE